MSFKVILPLNPGVGRANIGHGQVQHHDLPDSGAEICGFETLHNPETRLGRDIEGVLHAEPGSFATAEVLRD